MRLIEDFKLNYFKVGTRKVEPLKVVISVIVVVFLILFYFYKSHDLSEKESDRKRNLRYTIGFTNKRYRNPKSSKPTSEFSFFYEQIKYIEREPIDADYEKLNHENKRYYVEFSSRNPRNCKLLLMFPVPDSVKTVPDYGWTHMPGYEMK